MGEFTKIQAGRNVISGCGFSFVCERPERLGFSSREFYVRPPFSQVFAPVGSFVRFTLGESPVTIVLRNSADTEIRAGVIQSVVVSVVATGVFVRQTQNEPMHVNESVFAAITGRVNRVGRHNRKPRAKVCDPLKVLIINQSSVTTSKFDFTHKSRILTPLEGTCQA